MSFSRPLLLFTLMVWTFPGMIWAEEPLNFSLLVHGGVAKCSGFLGEGDPSPAGGLWMGVALSDRFDGLWALDYYTMPSQSVTVHQDPTASNPVSLFVVSPANDFSLTVNTRWYWGSKRDEIHKRFNMVPYFVAGLGMDFIIDEPPPPPSSLPSPTSNFYNKSYDALFAMNFGAGLDFPLDGQLFLYAEGMDHLIAWEQLTQIFSARMGIKIMLDSAHADPLRGIF